MQPLIANNDMDTMLDYVNTPLRNAINKTKKALQDNGELDARKLFIKNMRETEKYANTSTKTLNKMYDTYFTLQNNLVGVLQGVKRVFLAVEKGVKGSKFLENFLKTADKSCQILILALNTLAAAFTTVTKKGKEINGIEIFGARKKAHILSFERLLNKLRKALGLSKEDFNNLKDTVKGVLDIFSAAWYVITEFVKAFIPAKENFKGMGSSVLEVTGYIGRLLTAFTQWVYSTKIVYNAAMMIRRVISLLIAPFRIAINFIGNFFKSIRKGNTPTNKFLKSIKSLWASLKKLATSIKDAAKAILDIFLKPFQKEEKKASGDTNIFTKVLDKLATAIKWLSDNISGAATKFSNFVQGFTKLKSVKAVGEAFHDVIFNKVVPAFMFVLDWGKKLVKGFKLDKASDSLETIKTKLSKSADSIKSINIADVLEGFKQKIFDGIDKIKNIDYKAVFESAKESFDNFVEFLGDVKDKIGEALSNVGKAIKETNIKPEDIAEKVTSGSLGDLLPDPKDIGVAVGNFLAAAVKFVTDAIPYFVEMLGAAVRTLFGALPDILNDLVKNVSDALDRALFQPLKVEIDGKSKEIPPLFDSLKEIFGKTLENIGKELSEATVDDLLRWVNLLFSANLINGIRKAIKQNTKGLTNFLARLSEQIDQFLGTSTAKKTWVDKLKTLADAILTFAKALAILVGVMWVLSMIPDDSLKKGGQALVALAAGVVIFAAALAAVNKWLAGDKLAAIAKGMGIFAGGLAALVVALC